MLWAICLGLLGGCTAAPREPAPERIVLISIDTLRADHVGSYGAAAARTPQLDTIAAQGVRFEVALSPVPLTLPAHASLMTGLDPPAHGVRHNSIHRLGPEPATLAERLRERGYATAAFVGALVLDRRFGLARGFELYDDAAGQRVSGGTGYAERRADAVVDAALAWLAQAPDRFFLWVHFYDPHASYRPPAAFAIAFPDDLYAGEIAFVDVQIGRLLQAIQARWGTAGLVVLATSDHGESLGEHGEPTHSYSLYEATQRVPLLLSGPGLPAGRSVATPVSLLDVAPTLLAWSGARALPQAAGRDLRGLLDGASGPDRPLYMETLAPQLDFGWSPLLALRVGRFKYVRAPRPELYDLVADPGERHDLAARQPERVAELDALLQRSLGTPRAPEPVRLPAADREGLRALGYVVPEGRADPVTLGRVDGIDPKDRMDVLEGLATARAALAAGRAAEALARLDALGDTGPFVLAQRAAAALAAGDAARAERDARAVLAVQPQRSDVRILLARALAEQGRLAEAGRSLAQLPADAAPAPWVAARAARAEWSGGDREAALRRLALARQRHPGDAELARLHGHLLDEAGRLEEALAAREAQLALEPDSVAARNDLAFTLARLGREPDRAVQLARDAVARGGERPELLDTLATALLASGEAGQARSVIDRALPAASGPTRQHLLELRARSLAAAGRGS